MFAGHGSPLITIAELMPSSAAPLAVTAGQRIPERSERRGRTPKLVLAPDQRPIPDAVVLRGELANPPVCTVLAEQAPLAIGSVVPVDPFR
jgi:hypothetical protein